MKKIITIILLCVAMVILFFAIVGKPSSISTTEGSTKAHLSGISNAIQIYEMEYSERPVFRNSTELADILEGKNKLNIKFYSFGEWDKNEENQIVDRWDNPIIAVSHNLGYTLISAGMNESFDHVEYVDDIVFHTPTRHNQSGDGQ
tara:strand:- start:400 stop:837 length:438 start_codon:yes stop_codon:yes gene_type:complete